MNDPRKTIDPSVVSAPAVEPEKLDSIYHVAVVVDNIETAVSWYTTSFNCQLEEHSLTQAVLRFANLKLKLLLPSQQPGHVAYCREDAHTLGNLKEQIDGAYQTFVADAAGNPVGVVGRLVPSDE